MKSAGDDLISASPDGEISILLIFRPILFILVSSSFRSDNPEWFGWENSSCSTPPMELKMQLDELPSDHPFFNFNGIFPPGMQPVNCHYFVSINTETAQGFSGPSPLETINSIRMKMLWSVKMWWVHTWNTENRQEELAFDCLGHISFAWRREIRIYDSSAHAEIKRCCLRKWGFSECLWNPWKM